MKEQQSIDKFLERARPTELTSLYKYRMMGARGLERIFTHNEIYLPDPTKFNDPFDCKPFLTTHKSTISREQFYRGIVKEKLPHLSRKEIKAEVRSNARFKKLRTPEGLEELFKEFIQGFGVYSLSEVPDDILMWSHYTDSHKGICLEFDATVQGTIFWEAYKVSYQSNFPVVNIMDMGNREQFYELFCTKSEHWAYEQERRVLRTPEEGGASVYVFEPELLTGVILGADISSDDAKTMSDLISTNKPNAKIYKAKLNRKSYAIDITCQ